MNKYPPYIMKHVRENLGLEENDSSRDKEINKMSKLEVLDKVATWNGLIGYGYTISKWVQDIYGIELEN